MPVGLRGFESKKISFTMAMVFSMPVGLRVFEYDLSDGGVHISFRCLSA